MDKITSFFSRHWKILIPVIAIIFIVIILSSAVMLITLDDGTYKEGDMGNVPYAASTYVKSIKFTEDGIKFIYTHTDETTGEEISEEKTSSEMAQITWDEMKKNGSTVENYLDSVDELEKLMNAEIITQYPKLDNVTGLNGTIEFERRKSDGTTVKLQFINLETFNSYIEEKRTDVINYYTLDDSGNVLIGVVDETTETLNSNDEEMELNEYSDSLSDANKKSEGNYLKTEYNVYSKSINYKSAVDKYTMPFQYLWSIIVIGDDKGVGLELADLVENSQIVISIFDNITTTVNESTYTYHKEKKVDVSATATANTNYGTYTKSDSWKKADEWKTDIDYEIKHVITYKNNTPIVDLTKADVWVVDYSKEYDYESSTQTSQENNERNLDDTEYVEDSDSPKSSSSGDGSDLDRYDKFKGKLSDLTTELEKDVKKNVTLVTENVIVGYEGYISKPIIEKRIKELTMSTDITSCKGNYYTHQVDKKEVDVSTTYSQKYVAKTPINNPKVEKKTEEEIKNGTGQNNFVTILSDSNHTNARRKITEEVTSWFFELLEENPDTVNMVDLTSYLLYKVTGDENRFNNSYDFSIYANNAFSFAGGGIYNGTIQEKVWFALKDLGYSDIAAAGAMGNIHYESGSFDPNRVEGGYTEETGGIGICQWTNNKRGSTGRNTNLRNYAASKGTTWQDENIQVTFLIGELTKGGGADGYASYQLMTTTKYYGSSLATATAWENAESVEDATKAFCYTFERPGVNYAASSMATRISYAQMYYSKYQGMTAPEEIDTILTGDNKQKMELMIAEAKRIANDDRYQYDQSNRNAEFYYDCSSFVSRLYQQYFGISRLDYGAAGHGTDNIKVNCQTNTVAMTNLQPGDILWKNGHVALYIGNNQLAEAMNTQRGIVISTFSKSRFTYAFRIIR